MMRYQRTVWIVEMFNDAARNPYWMPTVGIGLDRKQGRASLQNWKNRCPGDKFRLAFYKASKP